LVSKINKLTKNSAKLLIVSFPFSRPTHHKRKYYYSDKIIKKNKVKVSM